ASMAATSAGDVRARARLRQRLAALAALAAVVLMAFCLTAAFISAVLAGGLGAQISATLAGALIGTACGALPLLARRHRLLNAPGVRLEDGVEELGDRNWELKDAAERGRSFLEALGDVIVRRDAAGRITYANDAFIRLTGRAPGALIGTGFAFTPIEQ